MSVFLSRVYILQSCSHMKAAVARSCFCSIIQQLFILEISTRSMMGNQLKSTLAVAVQMVTPSLQKTL